MNRKVLQAVIVLAWVFLITFAVMKTFFGEWFLAVVTNEKVLMVGSYIDNSMALRLAADTVLGVISMHFYLCACKQIWNLPWYGYLLLLMYAVTLNIGYAWNATVLSIVELCFFILIPLLMRAKWGQTIPILLIHYAGQVLLLVIRSEPLYLVSTNYATWFLLVFDFEIWLTLYYLYSNLYKEKTLWEWLVSLFSAIKRKRNSKKNL